MLPISELNQRFANGETYEQYRAHMQKNLDLIDAITPLIKLSSDEERFFRSLRAPIRVLVVSEDWCPDCALNVPILMRIAATSRAFDVRFINRDDNFDLLAFAKKGERKAIPTFFFFDEQWNEIGNWVERPVRADALLREWDHIHAAPSEPDRTAAVWRDHRRARSEYRNELFLQHGLWRDSIDELRRILAGEMVSNVASEHTTTLAA